MSNLHTARTLVAATFPGSLPAQICLRGGMDAGCPIKATVAALEHGPIADPIEREAVGIALLKAAREAHGDPAVAKLPANAAEAAAVIAALTPQ